MHVGEPMGGREIEAGLPFFSAAFRKRFRRNPELHELAPS